MTDQPPSEPTHITVAPEVQIRVLADQRNAAMDRAGLAEGAVQTLVDTLGAERAAWQAERELLVGALHEAGVPLPAVTRHDPPADGATQPPMATDTP